MKNWLENYNNSKVTTPEGFHGDGYTSIANNKNPAWGGQFQMGGTLPGATGMMYARTDSITSNNKHKKKPKTNAQNGKEMQYYREGLDFQPKSISQNGNIIDDDNGQWDHPGEVTRITGGNITMQPNPITGKSLTQLLLGISDKGEQQIMKPGKNYKFKKGTKNVIEYPLSQNGEELDQLTNFSNYNTKQPGGWMDQI
jgi:hypothetical protein